MGFVKWHESVEVNNAVKHGAYAKGLILPDENVDEFIELVDALMEEWKPVGYLEEETVMTFWAMHLAKTPCRNILLSGSDVRTKTFRSRNFGGNSLERRYAQHGPGRARRNQSLI